MASNLLDPAALRRAVLPNGLTALIYRNPAVPVVAINTYVRAGYFDETDDVVGIAHVLEHMFFKGTSRRAVGEIAKQTKGAGGYLNAQTIYDHTSYYTVLPASGFAEGLDIQADAYANSVVDADELAKELEVIIQEAKRKSDNPSALATETLYELLHDQHRIRRWRIGREEGLRTLTRDAMLRFYRNFYTPGNTIIAIVGNVDPDDALARVERLYGSLSDPPVTRSPGPREPEHADFRYRELSGDVAQTQLELGWRTVPLAHPDTPALDLTASVLGAGRASRLYRSIRDRKLGASVGAYNYTPTELGVFVIHAETEPEKTLAAARAAWDQLRDLREGSTTAAEVERARRMFASRWSRRLETSDGQASYLTEWEAAGGWRLGDEYYDAFMRLGVDDVTRVTRQYLGAERAGVLVYRPKNAPSIAPDPRAMRAALDDSQPPAPLEASPAASVSARANGNAGAAFVREEAGVRVYQTASGVPILVRVRPGAAITYSGVYFMGGARGESAETAGITTLAARTAPRGTATRTAVQIAEAGELLGGSVSASVGGESFGWGVSVPRDNIYAALALLGDVAQHATIGDDELETERRAALLDVAELRDDMYRFPMRLVSRAAFGEHPYGIPTLGTESSLQSISPRDAREWYRTMRQAPCVVAVAGDVQPDEVADAAARELHELRSADPLPVAAPRWPREVVIEVAERDRAQTALGIAFEAPARCDDDRFAARLLATLSSGLGGRFFDELRDRQSLAYIVHSFSSEYQLAGMFVSYIATSPEKEETARAGLLAEFAKLCHEPVSDEELMRAKRYALGAHAIRQESGAAVLGDILDAWMFGRGLEELASYEASVQAVSADDLLALARRYFDPDRRVEGIVRGTGQLV